MSGQTKRHSIIEAVLNVATGMIIAFTISQVAHWQQDFIQTYIWSEFKWELSFQSNLIMTVVLTVCSVLKSYIWRRIFNKIHLKTYK